MSIPRWVRSSSIRAKSARAPKAIPNRSASSRTRTLSEGARSFSTICPPHLILIWAGPPEIRRPPILPRGPNSPACPTDEVRRSQHTVHLRSALGVMRSATASRRLGSLQRAYLAHQLAQGRYSTAGVTGRYYKNADGRQRDHVILKRRQLLAQTVILDDSQDVVDPPGTDAEVFAQRMRK